MQHTRSSAAHAAAQHYQRASALLASRAFDAARAEFDAAARLGHVQSLSALAAMCHHGWGQSADPPTAMALYRQACTQGDGDAAVRLAIAHLHGRWAEPDPAQSAAYMVQAMRAQHPQAQGLLQLLSAVLAEDPARVHSAQPEWLLQVARGQLRVDRQRLLDLLCAALDVPAPAQMDELHRQPRVLCVDGVLRRAECRFLIEQAAPRLQPARVISPETRQLVQDPIRNNQSTPLGTSGADLPLALIEWRLARLAALPLMQAELLAVLRYLPGEEYRPHRDYIVPASQPEHFRPGGAGQRIRTLCAYLNAVPAGGGETEFPLLNLRIQPQPGRVLIFDNVDPEGHPDPNSLHAGRPVRAGQKWLATLWFRAGALRVS